MSNRPLGAKMDIVVTWLVESYILPCIHGRTVAVEISWRILLGGINKNVSVPMCVSGGGGHGCVRACVCVRARPDLSKLRFFQNALKSI